jgi:hypothetical protein
MVHHAAISRKSQGAFHFNDSTLLFNPDFE